MAGVEVTHKALPAGWSVHEDESGRIYFAHSVSQVTSWQDPRVSSAHLSEFDHVSAPAYVKAALYLARDAQAYSFNFIDSHKLGLQIQRHRQMEEGAFITKAEFEKLCVLVLVDALSPGERSAAALRIVDRVFSLLDLPFRKEAEFRATLLALAILSEIPLRDKVTYVFNIVDSQNRGELNSNQMFVLLMLVSRLVENPHYRYKIAPDTETVGSYVRDMHRVSVKGVFTLEGMIRYVNMNPLPLRHIIMAEKLRLSRNIEHRGKTCGICHATPIKGIRYRAADPSVKHVSMCQTCFWAGREGAGYKRGMPVVEYTTNNSFGKRVANRSLLLDAPNVPRSGVTPVTRIGQPLNLFNAHAEYVKHGRVTSASSPTSPSAPAGSLPRASTGARPSAASSRTATHDDEAEEPVDAKDAEIRKQVLEQRARRSAGMPINSAEDDRSRRLAELSRSQGGSSR